MPRLLDKVRKQIDLIERSIQEVDMTSSLIRDSGPISLLHQIQNAEFRNSKFRFRDDLKLKSLNNHAGRIIRYADLCQLLRKYIIGNELMLDSGRIRCDSVLKTITNKDETSFFDIAKSFTAILA